LGEVALPAAEEWRLNSGTYPKLSSSAGIWLDSKQHIVRANHFKVSQDRIPTFLFHYSVAIHKLHASGEIDKEGIFTSINMWLDCFNKYVCYQTLPYPVRG